MSYTICDAKADIAALQLAVQQLQNAPGPTLDVTTEQIRGEVCAGAADDAAVDWVRGATMTRLAVGLWRITFGSPHPDGDEYNPVLTSEEESNFRDTPDITVVEGTLSATGFDYQITTGDNGAGADVYVDTPHSWSVFKPVDVITSITLT
jgi:hypothetical protein